MPYPQGRTTSRPRKNVPCPLCPPPSIWWQAVPYFLLGASETLTNVGASRATGDDWGAQVHAPPCKPAQRPPTTLDRQPAYPPPPNPNRQPPGVMELFFTEVSEGAGDGGYKQPERSNRGTRARRRQQRASAPPTTNPPCPKSTTQPTPNRPTPAAAPRHARPGLVHQPADHGGGDLPGGRAQHRRGGGDGAGPLDRGQPAVRQIRPVSPRARASVDRGLTGRLVSELGAAPEIHRD